MLQTVRWTTDKRLSCTGLVPAQVVLQLSRNIVIPQQCNVPSAVLPSAVANSPYQFTMVSAEISQVLEYRDNCGVKVYRYTFSYDDGQILSGETIFTEDIQAVFCRGALTQWVTEQAGNDVTLDLIGSEYILTNQHGCKYAFPYVDPALSSKLVLPWAPTLGKEGSGDFAEQTVIDTSWEEFAGWAWFQITGSFRSDNTGTLDKVIIPFPSGASTALPITGHLPVKLAVSGNSSAFVGKWRYTPSTIELVRHNLTFGGDTNLWLFGIDGKIKLDV